MNDHLDHVTKQMPYACSVALVAIVAGYMPVGFAYSPISSVPVGCGIGLLYLLVRLIGRGANEWIGARVN